MENQKQIQNYKILGIIFLCEFAIAFLIFLLFIGMFLLNAGLFAANSNKLGDFAPTVLIYGAVIVFYIIFMMPFGVGGWKLLKNKSGAKGWGVAASVLSLLFFFPLGLIIGIVGFILLFQSYENTFYQNRHQPDNYPPNPPQNRH